MNYSITEIELNLIGGQNGGYCFFAYTSPKHFLELNRQPCQRELDLLSRNYTHILSLISFFYHPNQNQNQK